VNVLFLNSLTVSKNALAIDGIYVSPHVGGHEFELMELSKNEKAPFKGVLIDEKTFRTFVDRSDNLDRCEIRLGNYSCSDSWSFESVKVVEKVAWFGFGALLAGFLVSTFD